MIRRAADRDLARCAILLGQAFADYPWTRWCVDNEDHVNRLTALQRLSLELHGFAYGHVWVLAVSGELRSVAVWSDSRVRVPNERLIELADRSRPLHGDRLTAAIQAERGGHRRPTGDHLFLETMGTDPRHQRRGFGAAVLAPGLEMADAHGIPCALETSTPGNVEFYRSVGFTVVGHRLVPAGGPDVWSMQRSPA